MHLSQTSSMYLSGSLSGAPCCARSCYPDYHDDNSHSPCILMDLVRALQPPCSWAFRVIMSIPQRSETLAMSFSRWLFPLQQSAALVETICMREVHFSLLVGRQGSRMSLAPATWVTYAFSDVARVLGS